MPKRKNPTDLSSLINKYKGISVVSEIESNLNKEPKTEIALSQLIPCDLFDERNYPKETLSELKKSLEHYGFLVPLIVVKREDGKREIINGVKRFLVAKERNRKSIPALSISLEEEKKHAYILQSIKKEDKDPLVRTNALKRLKERYGYKEEELALLTGSSISQIRNLLRRDSLPSWVKRIVHGGGFSYGQARVLLNLDRKQQERLADKARKEKLSVREREKYKRERKDSVRKRKVTIKGKTVTIVFEDEEEAKKNYPKILRSFSD